MARQTRSQRRARRQAQQESNAVPVRAQARHESAPAPRAEEHPVRERERRGGAVNFVRESVGELKKVEWPGQSQVIQGVTVVIIACVIVGAWLFASDLVFKRLVQNVFLGQ